MDRHRESCRIWGLRWADFCTESYCYFSDEARNISVLIRRVLSETDIRVQDFEMFLYVFPLTAGTLDGKRHLDHVARNPIIGLTDIQATPFQF